MNEDIKKMAHLLRTGHTMLNQACPICNNPIFKNAEGFIFCPVCNREIRIVDDKKDKDDTNSKQIIKGVSNQNGIVQNNYINNTINVLIQKINFLNEKMHSETNFDIINKYSSILLKLYKILKIAKNIK